MNDLLTPQIASTAVKVRSRTSGAWTGAVLFVLVILIGLTFIEALHSGFVDWDDDDLLFAESRYQVLTPSSLKWMFTTFYAGHYQPLTWLSYWLDWNLWNREAFGFHLTNVVLHIGCAILIFFITRRFTSPRPLIEKEGGDFTLRTFASGFAAAVFALHPLRAESVAWIAERHDVLGSFFFLAAVYSYLIYAQGGPSKRKSRTSYACTFAMMGLSLLANATATMLPLVLLILDLYPLRRRGRGFADATPSWRRLIVEKVPLFALSLTFGLLAVAAQARQGALYPLAEHSISARAAQVCYGLAFYLWKTVAPTNLGPLYELPPQVMLFGWMLAAGAVTVGIVLIVVILARRRAPWLLAAFGIYALLILPVSGLAQSGPQLVADRYSYLACGGFAVLAGAALLWVLKYAAQRRSGIHRAAVLAGMGAMIAALHVATFHQCAYWRSPFELWRRGVEVCPTSTIAHTNFADALSYSPYLMDAAWHYRQALKLNPNNAIAVAHYATLQARMGNAAAAITLYEHALNLDPSRSSVFPRLAHLYIQTGKPAVAVTLLKNRLHLAPDDLATEELLADLLSSFPDASIRSPEESAGFARRLNAARGGSNAQAMMYLATALAEQGAFEQSISVGETALAIASAHTDEQLARELRHRLRLFRAHHALSDGK